MARAGHCGEESARLLHQCRSLLPFDERARARSKSASRDMVVLSADYMTFRGFRIKTSSPCYRSSTTRAVYAAGRTEPSVADRDRQDGERLRFSGIGTRNGRRSRQRVGGLDAGRIPGTFSRGFPQFFATRTLALREAQQTRSSQKRTLVAGFAGCSRASIRSGGPSNLSMFAKRTYRPYFR